MHYQHKSVGGGKMISMNGVSLLKIDNGIYFHQDWFDLGAMLYEHVPVVGGVVRFIKTKVTAKIMTIPTLTKPMDMDNRCIFRNW